jgi:TATA-box binding protein (TBP) (component of TFIID and TFIIIB)
MPGMFICLKELYNILKHVYTNNIRIIDDEPIYYCPLMYSYNEERGQGLIFKVKKTELDTTAFSITIYKSGKINISGSQGDREFIYMWIDELTNKYSNQFIRYEKCAK